MKSPLPKKQRTRNSCGTTSVYRICGLVGSKKIRKLYRAIPSSPTKGSAKPLRKEFYTAVLLPRTDRQLSEKTDGCILVFIIAFCVYIFSHSTTFAFLSQCEIQKKCKKIRRICNKPPGAFPPRVFLRMHRRKKSWGRRFAFRGSMWVSSPTTLFQLKVYTQPKAPFTQGSFACICTKCKSLDETRYYRLKWGVRCRGYLYKRTVDRVGEAEYTGHSK